MILYYCGFNGFEQIGSKNQYGSESSTSKVDCCRPCRIFELETKLLDVFVGWSRLIITTGKIIGSPVLF